MTDPAPQYDPAKVLTYCALLFVIGAIVCLSAIVGWQIYTKDTAETVWVGQLCAVIGWVLGQAGSIYNNRFGTTTQSAAKDDTIKQQAKTAAAAQGALLDPAFVVSIDPTRRAPAAGAPLVAETINVDATTANVTEKTP